MGKAPRLEQFSATYNPVQDRIMLRLRSSDDAEYRFWITRRYLTLLWPLLMKMADTFAARKAPADQPTRAALAELAHGKAVGGADFSSHYQDGSVFPLGEEPILLARIAIKPSRDNTQTLTLLPEGGKGINLDLDERLLHLLARLLQETSVAADWKLALRVITDGGAAPEEPAAASPRLLH